VTDTHVTRAAQIVARLDRLPASRTVWTLLLMLSLGGAFEFYDLFLMGYIGPGLVRSGLFSAGSVTLFGLTGLATFVAATFTGLFIGTIVFSVAADRFGRRAVFTWSLLWYTAASCVMAMQTTTNGVLVWRGLTGIGIGVELVTIDTYIAELMPSHVRGRAFAVNQVVQFLAVPFVAFLSWRLIPTAPLGIDGWRWVVLIGAVSAVLVWFIRRAVPESPRWLVARGRLDEADAVTRQIEAQVAAEGPRSTAHLNAGASYSPDSTAFLNAGTTHDTSEVRFARAFQPPYTTRTLMLMVFNAAQTIGYYGFASWVPTLLIARGITTTTSLGYSFAIALAAPVGPLLTARFADAMDRKWQIVCSAAAIAVFGLLFSQTSGLALIIVGVLLTCSNNWMSVAFHAYQAELYPTAIRAQAVGFVYSWSRFSAIFTSLIIGFLLGRFGATGVFVFIAGAMAVAGGVEWARRRVHLPCFCTRAGQLMMSVREGGIREGTIAFTMKCLPSAVTSNGLPAPGCGVM
jgi:putative MFS transporter